MISIILSLFTALFVSKYLTRAFYAVGFKNEKFYGRAKERKPFNFIKNRRLYFIISVVVIAAGIIGMIGFAASGNRALNYSLEFVGGTSTTVVFDKDYTVDELESEVVPVIADAIGDSNIQSSAVSGSNSVVFKTKTLTLDQRDAMNNALVDAFGVDESLIESQSISSTISNEMRSDAVIAVIVACFFMLLYIWFRFKDIRFAASAILALVHDVLVVLTAYALIRISVGNTFIACMLTIVGYSVNDTIVIFDRIRENLHSVKVQTPETLAAVADKSLTQTLSRSINTSITTIIMVLLLFILGVSSIREFALPLMVGLISGSYSSIFIATELWYVMKLHLGKSKLIKK
jgi:SecD/SecF fusion protein